MMRKRLENSSSSQSGSSKQVSSSKQSGSSKQSTIGSMDPDIELDLLKMIYKEDFNYDCDRAKESSTIAFSFLNNLLKNKIITREKFNDISKMFLTDGFLRDDRPSWPE